MASNHYSKKHTSKARSWETIGVSCQGGNGLHCKQMTSKPNFSLQWRNWGPFCFSVLMSVWTLTAVEVDEEDPLEVPVIDECCMHTWAWLMVYREVTVVWVPSKQVELLLINDQFLKKETCILDMKSKSRPVTGTTLFKDNVRFDFRMQQLMSIGIGLLLTWSAGSASEQIRPIFQTRTFFMNDVNV